MIRGVIFDLDGVLTDTASVHARAWKLLFDGLFEKVRSEGGIKGVRLDPFSAEDYTLHVDGKPREDGIRALLLARGVTPTLWCPHPKEWDLLIAELAEAKNKGFWEILRDEGVQLVPGVEASLEALNREGVTVAVASSSRNCRLILELAGLLDRFEVVMDGATVVEHGLRGKPAPDLFLFCANAIGLAPQHTAVVEDAASGVQAAVEGGFGLVIGVATRVDRDVLIAEGAHLVEDSLAAIDFVSVLRAHQLKGGHNDV